MGFKNIGLTRTTGNGGYGNRDGNEGVEDAADALRINNAAVRESQIRGLGEIRTSGHPMHVRADILHAGEEMGKE